MRCSSCHLILGYDSVSSAYSGKSLPQEVAKTAEGDLILRENQQQYIGWGGVISPKLFYLMLSGTIASIYAL